jgi:hypothetical protein
LAIDIVETFTQLTGNKAVFIRVTPEEYQASLPKEIALK